MKTRQKIVTNGIKMHSIKLAIALAISTSLFGCVTTNTTQSTPGLTVKKDNALSAFLEGKQKYAVGDYAAAEKLLKLATADRNMFAEAHLLLGNIYFRENLFNQSVVQYQQALNKEPKNIKANNNLLMLHLRETTRSVERLKGLSGDASTQIKTQNLLSAIEEYLDSGNPQRSTQETSTALPQSNAISTQVQSVKVPKLKQLPINVQPPLQAVPQASQASPQTVEAAQTINVENVENVENTNGTSNVINNSTAIETTIAPVKDSKTVLIETLLPESPTLDADASKTAIEKTIKTTPIEAVTPTEIQPKAIIPETNTPKATIKKPEKLKIKLKPAAKLSIHTNVVEPSLEQTVATATQQDIAKTASVSNSIQNEINHSTSIDYYQVQQGDSLSSIVESHHSIGGNFYQRIQAFANINSEILNQGIKSYVEVGEKLKIPSLAEVESMPAARDTDTTSRALEPLQNNQDATINGSSPSVDNNISLQTLKTTTLASDHETELIKTVEPTPETNSRIDSKISIETNQSPATAAAEPGTVTNAVTIANQQLATTRIADNQSLIEKKQELARLINEYKTKLSQSKSKQLDLLKTIEEKSRALESMTTQ